MMQPLIGRLSHSSLFLYMHMCTFHQCTEFQIEVSYNGTTLPGYILLMSSMNDESKPAITDPPTGTIKFLSVL